MRLTSSTQVVAIFATFFSCNRPGAVTDFEFTKNGNKFLALEMDGGVTNAVGFISIYKASDQKKIGHIGSNNDWNYKSRFAFEKEKKLLANREVIFDFKKGDAKKILPAFTHPIAISSDANLYAIGKYDPIKLFNLHNGKMVSELGPHNSCNACFPLLVEFHDDYIISGGSNGRIHLWNSHTLQRIKSLTHERNSPVIAVRLFADSKRLLSSYHDHLRIWDLKTNRKLFDLNGHKKQINTADLSFDNRYAVSGSCDGTIIIWDLSTRRTVHRLKADDGCVWSTAFSPNGRFIVSGGDDGIIKLWDAQSGRFIRSFLGHEGAVSAVDFTDQGTRILSGSTDTTLRIWDRHSGRQIAMFVTFQGEPILDGESVDDPEWIAITPEGFFNASANGAQHLNVRIGNQVMGVDQFYDRLYRPDLVQEALAGDPKGWVANAAARLDLAKIAQNGTPPRISIRQPTQDTTVTAPNLDITLELEDTGGGIGRIEWRVNGTTLRLDCMDRGVARTDSQPAASATCRPRGLADLVPDRRQSLTLTRSIALAPGQNIIEVVAYNAANLIVSTSARRTITLTEHPSAPAQLYVLAIGVDDYRDSNVQPLNYAVHDARSLAHNLRQAGTGLYHAVHATELLDRDATAATINRAFQTIATQARPQDTFVLFMAGHGKTLDGRYYFIPPDFRYRDDQTDRLHAALRQSAIAQEQWQAWLATVQARKSLWLLDTCDSGTVVGDTLATRSIEQHSALERLTRATGRTVIAATTDDAPAREGYRGHGVFTYVLLQALQQADQDRNGLIETTELAHYVDQQVPRVSTAAFGQTQQPMHRLQGGTFPVGQQLAKLELPLAQPRPLSEPRTVTIQAPSTVAPPNNTLPESALSAEQTQQLELLLWRSIKHSNNPKRFREYLQRFPNGAFVPLAKFRLKTLDNQ